MTSILISRLQLNLRSSHTSKISSFRIPASHSTGKKQSQQNVSGSPQGSDTSTFFTIGNLGEELEGSFLTTILDREEGCEKEDVVELTEIHPICLPDSKPAAARQISFWESQSTNGDLVEQTA